MIRDLQPLRLLFKRLLVKLHTDQIRPRYIIVIVQHCVSNIACVNQRLHQELPVALLCQLQLVLFQVRHVVVVFCLNFNYVVPCRLP